MASEIKDILNKLARNQIDVDQAAELLSQKTVSDLDFSKVDLERQKRTGYPEVIYGEGKTVDQIVAIMSALHTNHQNIWRPGFHLSRLQEFKRRCPTSPITRPPAV